MGSGLLMAAGMGRRRFAGVHVKCGWEGFKHELLYGVFHVVGHQKPVQRRVRIELGHCICDVMLRSDQTNIGNVTPIETFSSCGDADH
jgi:hypothetical protein